jgi:hypothetical protein
MAQEHDEGAGTAAARAGPPAGRPARQPIDAMARARIGLGLKLHYARVLALPIPDHLRALLDVLAERAERESSR